MSLFHFKRAKCGTIDVMINVYIHIIGPPTTPYLPSPTCGTPCDMAMQCTYGQSIGTDEFGCQICECNPGKSSSSLYHVHFPFCN